MFLVPMLATYEDFLHVLVLNLLGVTSTLHVGVCECAVSTHGSHATTTGVAPPTSA